MNLAELGEFGFIERLRRRLRPGRGVEIGIGDDCAVVRAGRRRWAFTTDVLVEDVHFRREWDRPEGLGARAFAVNASDVAAMGGTPRWALLALSLPGDADAGEADALVRGFVRAARREGCELVGGNLSAAPVWMIAVALVGECAAAPLTRAGARPGDVLCVSGPVGGAARARELLLSGRRVDARRTLAFRRPVPRLALGRALARRRLATAAIDVSDGLLQDLGHLCRASRVGALVEAASVPFSRSLAGLPEDERLRLALGGGEDYELLFAAPASRERELARLDVSVIGRVVRGRGVRVVGKDGRAVPLRPSGFDHFSRARRLR